MNIKELREKSVDDIKKLLDDTQLNQFRLRMAKNTGQLAKSHEIKSARRLIARLKTLLTQKKDGN